MEKLEKMESLQRLAITALMSLFKDCYVWEYVEDELMKMKDGWKLWVVEEELQKEWEKGMTERKKKKFKDVHRQLVSSNITDVGWCKWCPIVK